MDKRHPIYIKAWPTWPKSLLHTSETWRLQLPINASFFKFPFNQNLTEADVKFELVKFCYIFFILYAINDILLNTVKNNIVACLCNAFYTNLFLWNTTIQYNTDILFPIKEPFWAEQLTKNLIQWLWIDYIDWKMTKFLWNNNKSKFNHSISKKHFLIYSNIWNLFNNSNTAQIQNKTKNNNQASDDEYN